MIIDAEADGLLDEATKIHVLAYKKTNQPVQYTHDYDEMRSILLNAKTLIGHNIICYDIPLFEKILGIKIDARPIDTLGLSFYLNHKRNRHGLEWYGEDYGIPKPVVKDWHTLLPQEYAHRCVEDVKINSWVWKDLQSKLLKLYDSKDEANRMIDYISFKMKCLKLQQDNPIKLDVDLCNKSLTTLREQEAEKLPELKAAMPMVPKYSVRTKPAKPYKKDGTLSVTGAKWFNLLKEHNLPDDHQDDVKVVVDWEEPKPNGHQQIKDWLFSLGWEPMTFKYAKNEDGSERKIPQVRVEGEEGKELCPSVKELIEKEPAVGVLDGLTVIQHRITVFEGFLDNQVNGYLTAEAQGFTNTLRLKHKVLVNLPGVDKPWGKEIRGCLMAPDGYEFCGADMDSLEENTKKHYMYPYDPDYVEEMSKPGFDAHLDLAKHAGAVTQQEIDDHVNNVIDLSATRKSYKAANYSCIYGVGAAKLSREIKKTFEFASKLIDAYWKRNWAVRQLAEDTVVKKVDGEMWLFNPVSRFWYSLRYKKDIFSTLNQGTGVYCFDRWIGQFLLKRNQLSAQFHDEVILCIKLGARDKCTQLLNTAISEVNEELKLNVKLSVGIEFGKRYSDIH